MATAHATLLALGLTCGCSVQHMAMSSAGEMLRGGSAAMNQEPDFEVARLAFPGNLKTVEVLLASDPDNPDFLFVLSQGFAAYTYLFVEDEIDLADGAGDVQEVKKLKDRASALYLRAQKYGAASLGPELTTLFETGDMEQLRKRLQTLEQEIVPVLFWYTFAWVGRINLDQSNPERVAELPRVEMLMSRVSELMPDYYFGLPPLTAGAIYAGRAPMFGGNLEKGKAALEAGVAVSQGKFLLGKFLLARYYAVQTQDSQLFCTQLQEVLATPDDALPEQQMMNNITKRWSTRWLLRAADLFADLDGGCVAPEATDDTDTEGSDDLLQ
jgi:hypothetical protein